MSNDSSTSQPVPSIRSLYVFTQSDADDVKDICINHVPFWKNLTRDDLDVQMLTFAATNLCYKLCTKLQDRNITPITSVALKRTSSFNSIVYDSGLQYEVCKLLGDNNCGPRVIGREGDYMIQEWVEGTSLVNGSFQNLSTVTSVAAALAKFHKRGTEVAPKEWDRTPFVLRQIARWSEHLERIIDKFNLDFDYKELVGFVETYKTVIQNHVKSSNSVANSVLFCHNDLFFKNIIDVQQGVLLIDFDYSGFNYVGYDIATLLMKIPIVYNADTFPYFAEDKSFCLSHEVKSIFVSVYLSQLLGQNVLPSDDVVEEFIQSLEVHSLGSNLFWAIWGIIMSDKPSNEICHVVSAHGEGKHRYNVFKSKLKELSEKNLIRY